MGREKAAEAGLSARVLLQIGDAQDLADIADGSVDKVNHEMLFAGTLVFIDISLACCG